MTRKLHPIWKARVYTYSRPCARERLQRARETTIPRRDVQNSSCTTAIYRFYCFSSSGAVYTSMAAHIASTMTRQVSRKTERRYNLTKESERKKYPQKSEIKKIDS
uniref:Uncharacterized protein n=1 Tax=Trichogramma kaykai TaxID=54128 RepID=A0ABD2VY25_9HYME